MFYCDCSDSRALVYVFLTSIITTKRKKNISAVKQELQRQDYETLKVSLFSDEVSPRCYFLIELRCLAKSVF